MRDVSKRDLPEDNETYDMTLWQIGYKDIRSKNPQVIVRAKIDNGRHKGKDVSHAFDFGDHLTAGSWRRFYQAIGVEPNGSPDKGKFLEPFLEACTTARFSATVRVKCFAVDDGSWRKVDRTYEGNYKVLYELKGFGEPTEPAEMSFKKGKSKFNRAIK